MSKKIFESSDSVRSAKALRYDKSANLDRPLQLERGGRLAGVTVTYETYGELNAARDNAILICHAISGDSHVARHDKQDDPGWWDIAVGRGKAIDTRRYFVICPNLLGGCRGTTGPGSIDLVTGKHYGRDFPTITVRDMVDVQRRLVAHLGIKQLLAVIGGSLGGHLAQVWAIRHPDCVRGVIALATSARLNSQALAFDVVSRNAILRDPHFHDGEYYGKRSRPDVGLALARMIGHITYLSREAMTEKFESDRLRPRDVAIEFEKRFSVGSYLGYQGTKFVERFDANSYLALTVALDLFDLGSTHKKLTAAFRKARARWLVVSFSSDWLFPPDQSRDIVNALIANRAPVNYCNVKSTCGHDAFLLPNELPVYGAMMRAFLDQLSPAPKAPAAVKDEGRGKTSVFPQHRLDHERIAELIPARASVLDLGCGSGTFLAGLRETNHRRLVGVELDEKKILTAISRGLDVIQADLNRGLGVFARDEFDCVVLSQTLQTVQEVERVLKEMVRIGRTCIVSIPNFGFHKLRHMLAETGRAPKAEGVLHYEWYNTPNIRFFTIADFEDFCRQKNFLVHRRIALDTEARTEVFEHANLNADLAIFVLSRK